MQLKSFDDITTRYQHIFLSPHFDDVVYSCGGTIGVQVSCGLRPLVMTIFAGIPSLNVELSLYAQQGQRSMGFGQDAASAVAARCQEDVTALDYLHVDYLWLDYADAIYRGTPAYYTSRSQLIGGEVHPGDLWIDRQLAQDLVALHERLPETVWYAPLGVGRHVDHQIVSSAAGHLIQRGARVRLYEDFPYVLKEGALEERLRELAGALEPAYVEMSEMLHLRQEAADMYASQRQRLFGGKAAMYKAMEHYTHSIRPEQTDHLERYWVANVR
jgi:LmbE family N-acetylglucosaminyl deacetylase